MTKSEQAAISLRERYPDGVAPTGAWTEIAAALGVSRELVRQVAQRLGIHRVAKPPSPRSIENCVADSAP